MKQLLFFSVVVFALQWIHAQSPRQDTRNSFSILTYNCENAFDTIHDTGFNDYDYLESGSYRWTGYRMHRKLTRVAQIFAAADTLKPVDIAILQEIENDSVMMHLLKQTALRFIDYRYVMTHNRTRRGVDVAVVYSPFTFHLLGSDTVSLAGHDDIRPILHVWGEVKRRDTLDIYALHLPSQLGGNAAAQNRRDLLVALRQHIDSVAQLRTIPMIVVAGDCNDIPESKTMTRSLHTLHVFDKKHRPLSFSPSPTSLYNLMMHRRGGSYKWHGVWEWLDQFIVSGCLLQPDSPLQASAESIRLLQLDALLEPDERFGGQRPFRTYYGPRYHGGYSDHLPVVLQLHIRTSF